MKLSRLLRQERILCDLKASSWDEVLEQLVRRLVEAEGLHDLKESILEALEKRRKQGAFSMGKGVAFPHARPEQVKKFYVTIANSRNGLALASPDGLPTRVIIFFIIPRAHSTLFLKVLAAFSNLLSNPLHLGNMANATEPEELMEYLDSTNLRIKESFLVRDVMDPQPPRLETTATVREAVGHLTEREADAVAIVEADGKLVGEVSSLQVIKLGLRKYFAFLGELSVLCAQEPFEEFLRTHGDFPVEQIMQRAPSFISESASVFDATLQMATQGVERTYVVREQALVGLLRASDVVARVLTVPEEEE